MRLYQSPDLINTGLVTLFLVLAMCQARPALTPAVGRAGDAYLAPTPSKPFHDIQAQSSYGRWDLAVAHGDNISLVTFDTGTSSIQEILIPFPVNSTASELYYNITSTSDGDRTDAPQLTPAPAKAPTRPFGQIGYIAVDSSRQLIFYTYLYEQPAAFRQRAMRYRDLNAYSLITKESVRLAHAINNNATFDDLFYSDNTLYWINAKSKHIMQLRLDPTATKSALPIGVPTPIVNLADVPGRHVTFDGLVLDPSTGRMYFGAWSSPTFGKSAIYAVDGNSLRPLLTENLHSPTSLVVTPDSHLYWIDKPLRSQYTIKRVKLAGDDAAILASRENVYQGDAQHWFEFTISCTKPGSNIFFTDMANKSLYQVHTTTGKQTLLKNYAPNVPQGLAVSHPVWISEANPLCSSPAAAETTVAVTDSSTTATANVPSSPSSSSTTEISAGADTNGPNPSASNEIVFYSCSPIEQFGAQCLNGGSCISSESDLDRARTHCLCTSEWTGPNCEINVYNSANVENVVTLPDRDVTVAIGTNADPKEKDSESFYLSVIVVMGVVVALLVLIVGILTFKVWLLTRKPKIRRRVFISRPRNQSGSLGRGRKDSGGQSVCELIDIENCCNMNVCETPCYESGVMNPEGDKNGRGNEKDSLGSASDVSVAGDHDKQQLII